MYKISWEGLPDEMPADAPMKKQRKEKTIMKKKRYITPAVTCTNYEVECLMAPPSKQDNTDPSLSDAKDRELFDEEEAAAAAQDPQKYSLW